MALPSGLAAQVGYKTESTYGTPVTVDTFIPLVSESVTDGYGRIDSEGIRAGRKTRDSDQWRAGDKTFSGSVQHEVTDNTIGILLEHLLGTVNTTGAGPYTHTITPADVLPSMTMQIGRPDTGGTVRAFTYAGTKITSAEFAGSVGQVGTLGLDVVAQSVSTATALATASYGSADALLTYVQGELSVAGSAPAVVPSFSLNIDNGVKVDRRTAGADTIREPVRNALMSISGSIEVEFEDLTQYNRISGATEADIILGFDDGTNHLKFTVHARFDDGTPQVAGRDILTQSLTFVGIGDGTDADAITCELINDDATP